MVAQRLAGAGKTNQWLALTGSRLGEAGNYQLVAMNDFGSVTSAVTSVSISIPTRVLKSPAFGPGGLTFSFQSSAGALYVTECKNFLTDVTWTELERRLGGGAMESVTDMNATTARYYRVWAVYPPPP